MFKRYNHRATRSREALSVAALWTVLVLFLPVAVGADEHDVWYSGDARGGAALNLYFFWSVNCPHCQKAKPFLEDLSQRYPWLRVHSLELIEHPENILRFVELAASLDREAQSVPAFIFCKQMYQGYDSDDSMGAFLAGQLDACYQAARGNHITEDLDLGSAEQAPMKLPLIGAVDPASLSLPLFTLLIAGMDAFNPCAFFVLLFLLSLLVHARSRARMALIGGVFVFFSGLVYFVFMAAWLNVFVLLGELKMLTLIAGLLAIVIGAINIKDFFWFKGGVSLSIPESAKPGLFSRMRRLVNARHLSTMLVGTVTLALVANSYELLCTAGFPMIYTRVLTLNELADATYYLYLVFYNLIYIVPLAVIVAVFTRTFGVRKLSEHEGRVLKLVSGLMMFGLGVLLAVAPVLLGNLLIAGGLLVFSVAAAFLLGRRYRTQQTP